MPGGLQAKFQMTGVDGLVRQLRELDRKMQLSISAKALRVGARIVQREAQSLAPERTGRLKQSIKVRTGRFKPGKRTVLVQTGKGLFVGHEFYAAFVELGHKAGPRKLGAKRADVPGEHFLKIAAEEKAKEAAAAVADSLRELISQAVRA